MRLVELFLKETSMEDRAIISLAQAIYDYLDKNYNDGAAPAPKEFTEKAGFDFDDEVDNYNDVDDDSLGDIEEPEEHEFDVGTIGEIFNTPLEILNPIRITLLSDYGVGQRRRKEVPDEISKAPNGENAIGLWYGGNQEMVLNMDYLGTNTMKSVIAHELRHALDDYKSEFKANEPGGRYSTPKKTEHRRNASEPKSKEMSYLAEPAEINARFIQVLHAMVPIIGRAAKLDPARGKQLVDRSFDKLMDTYNISSLFPEKTASKDYKRLLKRGVDFIDKEMTHVKSQQNNQK
jgi:hypothetical protein